MTNRKGKLETKSNNISIQIEGINAKIEKLEVQKKLLELQALQVRKQLELHSEEN